MPSRKHSIGNEVTLIMKTVTQITCYTHLILNFSTKDNPKIGRAHLINKKKKSAN